VVYIVGSNREIFEHFLVPKHEILSEKEVEELLKKYNVTKDKLPKILVTDPAVKAIGAKVGDVIKIERESPTAGKVYYYRVVISPGESLEVEEISGDLLEGIEEGDIASSNVEISSEENSEDEEDKGEE